MDATPPIKPPGEPVTIPPTITPNPAGPCLHVNLATTPGLMQSLPTKENVIFPGWHGRLVIVQEPSWFQLGLAGVALAWLLLLYFRRRTDG